MRQRFGLAPLRLAILAVAIGVSACAGSSEGAVEPTAQPVDPYAPPLLHGNSHQPTTDDPLVVSMVGDPLLADLSRAVVPTLNETGLARAEFQQVAQLPRSDAADRTWREILDRRPDVVTVLFGGREDALVRRAGGAGWSRRYRQDVVEPFIDMITSTGAQVLWIGFPELDSELGQVVAGVAADDPDVAFLESTRFLSRAACSAAGAAEPVRLLSTEGADLCADGVEALAEPVLAMIDSAWGISPAADWRNGEWRADPALSRQSGCEGRPGQSPPTTDLGPVDSTATGQGRLQVAVAGDSLMREVAAALEEALDGDGAVDTKFVLNTNADIGPVTRRIWEREVEQSDPDVIVVMVGFWELDRLADDSGEPGWQRRYRDDDLSPFIDLITSGGASVIWVGMPPVPEGPAQDFYGELNSVFRSVARQRPDVMYVDPAECLSGPDGEYLAVTTTPVGEAVRLRRIDQLHLCPAGVVRVAAPILERIRLDHGIIAGSRWRDGAWSRPPEFPRPHECPVSS